MTPADPSRQAPSLWPWLLSSLLVLAFAFGIWALGDRFVYGEGHAERPIWILLGFYTIGWMGLAVAYGALQRGNAPSIAIVLGVAVMARGLILDSNLVQSSDVYRYVLDGETLLHGVNPYRHEPAGVNHTASESFRAALESAAAQRVLERVSYPEIRTIYPPLAQIAFAAGAWLTPWNWIGQRFVVMACDIAVMGVLLALLARLRLPRAWVVFYAWNPLVLKEVVNSAHVDGLAALCVVVALYAAVRSDEDDRARWPLLCGLALGGAVLAKLFPIILLPAFAVHWYGRSQSLRAAAAFSTTFAVAVLLFYLPFAGVGFEALTEGLRRYAGEWRRNEGLYALIDAILPSYDRAACSILIGACAVGGALYLLCDSKSLSSLIAVLQFTLLGWLLLLPAPYPWYATPLIAICALRPRLWAIVMSGALATYYYSFIHEYRGHPDAWLAFAQAFEHGSVLLVAAVSLFAGYRSRNAPTDTRPLASA